MVKWETHKRAPAPLFDWFVRCCAHSQEYSINKQIHLIPCIGQSCPDLSGVGICVNPCRSNDDCSSGRICCRSGCGMTCAIPVTTTSAPSTTTSTVTCSYGGREYRPGDSFTASDGCNTWYGRVCCDACLIPRPLA